MPALHLRDTLSNAEIRPERFAHAFVISLCGGGYSFFDVSLKRMGTIWNIVPSATLGLFQVVKVEVTLLIQPSRKAVMVTHRISSLKCGRQSQKEKLSSL